MRTRILVVDDEEPICEILKYNLEKEGYDVDCAYSAEEALELDLTEFQLCLVDIMMDRLSGIDFLKRVRRDPRTEYLPVIFCSALNGEDDTVMGLNTGADDYIAKPFVISEVIARVRAVLRRSDMSAMARSAMVPAAAAVQPQQPARQPAKPVVRQAERASEKQVSSASSQNVYEEDLVYKTLRVDQNDKMVYLDGHPLNLSPTEFGILRFLLTHPGKIFSREEIIKSVWGDDIVVTGRTVDTNITRLRGKLGIYGANIVTRLRFGYGFKETV